MAATSRSMPLRVSLLYLIAAVAIAALWLAVITVIQ